MVSCDNSFNMYCSIGKQSRVVVDDISKQFDTQMQKLSQEWELFFKNIAKIIGNSFKSWFNAMGIPKYW